MTTSTTDDIESIQVEVSSPVYRGNRIIQTFKVDVLSQNINVFITQVEALIKDTPKDVGNFQFSEFTVSAEVSAKGSLVILGSGGEMSGKGALTFKFTKK